MFFMVFISGFTMTLILNVSVFVMFSVIMVIVVRYSPGSVVRLA